MRPSSGALGQDEAVVLQFVTHLQGPAELSFPRLATGRRRPGKPKTKANHHLLLLIQFD
jgi:hypothetical protein